MTPSARAVLALCLLFACLAFSVSPPLPIAADLPIVFPGTDASRTVGWGMNTSAGLTLQGVELSGGAARLPWTYTNTSWPDAQGFTDNGTLDANLTTVGSGIVMAADSSNHVLNGDFAANASWGFGQGAGGRVSTGWDAVAQDAVARSESPSTESLWDGMNSTSGWKFDSSPNITAGFHLNTTNPREGTGMIEIDVTNVFDAAAHYVGIEKLSPVNWSRIDRLALWVNMSGPDSVTFRVTAINSTSIPVQTAAQTLAPGWQELAVDLRELGSDRAALSAVTLRFDGVFSPPIQFYLDDARTGLTKEYVDSAVVSQSISKSSTTSPTLGNAVLALNWTATSVTNVSQFSLAVNVSGPLGTFERSLPISSASPWQRAYADVSSIMSSPDTYLVSLKVLVKANTTGPINATIHLDDVVLTIPNRHDGTYLSAAVPLGTESEYLRLTWSAAIPDSASVEFALRSGNSSSPNDGSWSPWQTWTTPGSSTPVAGGGSWFQVQGALTTTNASVTPVLDSMSFETRHHTAQGSIVSGSFTAQSDFLKWRTLMASFAGGSGTSVAFYVGDGSYWTPAPPGSNLTDYAGRSIRWRAVLGTSNGLETPAVTHVDLIYEYLGPIVRVTISPGGPITVASGATVSFRASALDPGSHVNGSAAFVWATDDRDGEMHPNGDYTAGTVGWSNITVTLAGNPGIFARVAVHVVAAPFNLVASLQPIALILAALAIAGYLVYTFVIRRMFAVDDLFLISKDGRLMLHNTRRMRADRDEDILSAMLTAILTFLRDFDPEEDSGLRRFEIGGKTALLERGRHAFLAAVYSGRVPRWAGKDLKRFMADLEVRFGATFAHWTGSPQDLQGLKEFSERFVSRLRYHRPRGSAEA
ncbi:MAG TPA: hypothetical protein VEO20_02675 [Thermoplasmata archaeon]|nr:hypothetical protein [Thermoplasmata archaeon]